MLQAACKLKLQRSKYNVQHAICCFTLPGKSLPHIRVREHGSTNQICDWRNPVSHMAI